MHSGPIRHSHERQPQDSGTARLRLLESVLARPPITLPQRLVSTRSSTWPTTALATFLACCTGAVLITCLAETSMLALLACLGGGLLGTTLDLRRHTIPLCLPTILILVAIQAVTAFCLNLLAQMSSPPSHVIIGIGALGAGLLVTAIVLVRALTNASGEQARETTLVLVTTATGLAAAGLGVLP